MRKRKKGNRKKLSAYRQKALSGIRKSDSHRRENRNKGLPGAGFDGLLVLEVNTQ